VRTPTVTRALYCRGMQRGFEVPPVGDVREWIVVCTVACEVHGERKLTHVPDNVSDKVGNDVRLAVDARSGRQTPQRVTSDALLAQAEHLCTEGSSPRTTMHPRARTVGRADRESSR